MSLPFLISLCLVLKCIYEKLNKIKLVIEVELRRNLYLQIEVKLLSQMNLVKIIQTIVILFMEIGISNDLGTKQ